MAGYQREYDSVLSELCVAFMACLYGDGTKQGTDTGGCGGTRIQSGHNFRGYVHTDV